MFLRRHWQGWHRHLLNFPLLSFFSVCCRSPIVPVRPTYSAELLTASFNGSLPRSAGGTGSAPDLSNGNTRGNSPADVMIVSDEWINACDTYTANTPVLQHRAGQSSRAASRRSGRGGGQVEGTSSAKARLTTRFSLGECLAI